jgi:hypothetical protein
MEVVVWIFYKFVSHFLEVTKNKVYYVQIALYFLWIHEIDSDIFHTKKVNSVDVWLHSALAKLSLSLIGT